MRTRITSNEMGSTVDNIYRRESWTLTTETGVRGKSKFVAGDVTWIQILHVQTALQSSPRHLVVHANPRHFQYLRWKHFVLSHRSGVCLRKYWFLSRMNLLDGIFVILCGQQAVEEFDTFQIHNAVGVTFIKANVGDWHTHTIDLAFGKDPVRLATTLPFPNAIPSAWKYAVVSAP